MTREVRLGLAAVAALGVFVFFMLVVGSLGGTRPEVDPLGVDEVLASSLGPAARYGDAELRIVGWYAELAADCEGDAGGPDASIAWLQRECPLRVLLPEQPSEDVTQAELERSGLRLGAPAGAPFPSRADPGGPNIRLQQLVFIGHFDDPAAADCVPERLERCRNTFVVSDYDGYVR
ncbi:MAG: hypothetical protein ACRDGJ_12235 [Candidatus Limnocylindria bacterium]